MSWHTQTDFFALAQQFGSPLWVYDAATIVRQIERLRAFDVIRYAQKACSNIHILRLMREHGVKVDAVSAGEVERALAAGYRADAADAEIVFTADLLDRATLVRVVELKIEVNCGSIDMLRQLGQASPGHRVWLRINPGFGHGHSHKTNTGGENSKHGIWHADLAEALAVIRQHGLRLVGLHMHIGSGVDYSHLEQVCGAMVGLAQQVVALDVDLEAISSGGGLSIPYQADQADVNTDHYFQLWQQARQQVAALFGHPVRLEIEPGRFLMAQAGALLTEVRAIKHQGTQQFALLDAGFNDLMRPAMYGSYHHVSRLTQRQDAASTRQAYVLAGPLCESGDVFTQHDGGIVQTRDLPELAVGDYVLFHDTGAYGASMSSNYNSRPLLAEVLLQQGDNNANAGARLIRRRQTMAQLLQLEL
ncbi:MAG: diaminopimelate decarboxylase [Pseudomonadota bacterium]|jgi:diaminopimelate decarboxylase